MEIGVYRERDREAVIELVLHCQNDGTRPPVSVQDQPELLCIERAYMAGGGNFWVARDEGRVAGSIGLMRAEEETGILKKFFVYEQYRGAPHHLGSQLYAVLLAFAREQGLRRLILDTPKKTERAHKFYERAGFYKIPEQQLPLVYDHPYRDCDFFCLDL